MNGRVLITGAGGFVGGHIVAALLDSGYHVLALDRAFDAGWQDRFIAHAAQLEILIADSATLPDTTVDALIVGTALTSQGELSNADYIRANLDPYLTALEWSKTHVRTKAIIFSSSGVYAKEPANKAASQDIDPVLVPRSESDRCNPDSLYGSIKAFIEHSILTAMGAEQDAPTCDWIVARLGSIYGPYELARPSRQHSSAIGSLIRQALEAIDLVDDGKLGTDWTYAPDIGRAVVALLQMPRLMELPQPLDHRQSAAAVYNVTSGQSYATRTILQAIKQCLPDSNITGKPSQIVDDGSANVAVRPSLANHKFMTSTNFDGWTSLHDGIGATIVWMKQHIAAHAEVQP